MAQKINEALTNNLYKFFHKGFRDLHKLSDRADIKTKSKILGHLTKLNKIFDNLENQKKRDGRAN